MNYISWEISLAALVPAFILCLYIYVKDRADKEPIHMLAALFGVGFLAYIPSLLCEKFLLGTVDNLFADAMSFGLSGTVQVSPYPKNFSSGFPCFYSPLKAVTLTAYLTELYILPLYPQASVRPKICVMRGQTAGTHCCFGPSPLCLPTCFSAYLWVSAIPYGKPTVKRPLRSWNILITDK